MRRLAQLAEVALGRAYAPYSGFRVGCALETGSGEIFLGCNIENAAYPATLCAERVALGNAVAAGHREIERILIVSDAELPIPPCGGCRQALAEFSVDLEVISRGMGGSEKRWRISELLPDGFSPAHLGADGVGHGPAGPEGEA